MYTDPVVEEVRRNGAMLAEECGGDVHRMAERLRQAAKDGGRPIVQRENLAKRRPDTPPPRAT